MTAGWRYLGDIRAWALWNEAWSECMGLDEEEKEAAG